MLSCIRLRGGSNRGLGGEELTSWSPWRRVEECG